jgi:hypothetical protein
MPSLKGMISLARCVAIHALAQWKRLVLAGAVGMAIAGLTNACASVSCTETLTCIDRPSSVRGNDAALLQNDGGTDAGSALDAPGFDVVAPDAPLDDAPNGDALVADARMTDATPSDAPATDAATTDASDGGDAQQTCPGANLMSDPANCGSCNHACGANFVCSSGACTAATGIRCANGAPGCTPGTQECCLATDNTLSCVPVGANACFGGAGILCNSRADCPGQLCCIQLDQNNALLKTGCFASCPSFGRRSSWLELCAGGTGTGAGTCARGTCRSLTNVTPSPPISPGWFSACQ